MIKRTFARIESDCTWRNFKNVTVKLDLALFEGGKIFGHTKMFYSKVFSSGQRHIPALVQALTQMPPRVTNITCITQATF